MIYIQLFGRLALLLLSFTGYAFFLSRRVKIEFVPGLLFSSIGGLLFAAGILNILQEAAWVIFAGGLYCLIRFRKEVKHIKQLLTPGICVFICLAGFFLVLLYQSEFVHYDNFSHWAVAAKAVCARDHFPNMSDTNVTFTSYPLGSTCFIYYVTEIVGICPEWLQMWAQAVLISAMAVSLFAFSRGKLHNCCTLAVVLMLLCSNSDFVDLLVDTLLPLTGFAAVAFCIYYRESIADKFKFVIPYTVFLVSIKNSGVLFAVYVMAYMLLHMKINKEMLIRWAKAAMCPFVVLYFWNQHVEQCFESGLLSKHSMNISNFHSVISQKSGDEILLIIEKFMKETFSWSNHAVILLIGLVVVFILSALSKRDRTAKMIAAYSAVCYALYQLGMLAMYLFSMPTQEAVVLAGYSRYHQTILIFVAALLWVALLSELAENGNSVFGKIIPLVTLLVLWCALSPNIHYYQKQNILGSDRERFDDLIEEYQIKEEGNYLIVVDEARDDSGYLYFLSQYLLKPQWISIGTAGTLSDDLQNGYDYVIMFEKTDEAAALIKDQFGVDDPVVRLK